MPAKSEGQYTIDGLGKVISRVEALRDRLTALQGAMSAEGIEELTIKGESGLRGGLRLAEHFADQGHRSFRHVLQGAPDRGSPDKKAKPKPKKRRQKKPGDDEDNGKK